MDPDRLTIGKVAERVGIPPKTLRYYEEVGLLPPPARSPGGYRLYSELDVRRADLVGRARTLGMGLDEIRTLVEFVTTSINGLSCRTAHNAIRAPSVLMRTLLTKPDWLTATVDCDGECRINTDAM